jgi:hypothetical protein
MGDEDVVEYDDDDEDDDEDNEDNDESDDDEDDDDNATINCWQQLGRRIREKETAMTTMTTTTMTTMTTMTMTAMTMKTTTTKQSTVGNNWGSRIGETETAWGCGMTEEGHGGGNLVEFFELNKINSKRMIRPPQSKRRTGT